MMYNLPEGIYEGIIPDIDGLEEIKIELPKYSQKYTAKTYIIAGKLFPYPIKETLFKIAIENYVDIEFLETDKHFLSATYWFKVTGTLNNLKRFGEDVDAVKKKAIKNEN